MMSKNHFRPTSINKAKTKGSGTSCFPTTKSNIQYRCSTGIWEYVESPSSSSTSSSSLYNVIPCERSLHAGAIWKDNFIIFGGYNGHQRINDLYSYNFKTQQWRLLSEHPSSLVHNSNTNGNNSNNYAAGYDSRAPSPRDRHIAVVYCNGLYIFGGFDGQFRVNGK